MTAIPERDLIQMRLAGFFDSAALAGFDGGRRAALAELGCLPNMHDTLADVRDLQLQAQDIVEVFRMMIADPTTRARRLAVVTGDAAVRMQVRRVVERDTMRCFADIGTAERWLAESRMPFALAG